MNVRIRTVVVIALALTAAVAAQTPAPRSGPPVQGAEEDIPLVARFDRNGSGMLERAERDAAREYLTAHPELRRPVRGSRINRTGTPGPKVAHAGVKIYPANPDLYSPDVLRTFFLEFEHPDWERELEAFWHTDVEVPAMLTVDGKSYRDVGVSFRGNNSFTAVPEGLKRPLSISLDFRHDQHLLGHRSLNLLNANQDPTFMRSVLYLDIARDYIPALKANFVRTVINGESWGIYVNQQTFSKEFLQDAFKTTKGTRWKSPNNSVGGGLSYLGDDIALYRRWYEMKGKDDPAAWQAVIRATKILNETAPEQLEQALSAVMDVDEILRFLALDVALVNGDGYWKDGSDFNLYLNTSGRLLVTPHDANEGFRTGGRAGGGAQPDPLVALDDANKALRSKLLAVPSFRTRYLAYVGDITEKWLDWKRLGPMIEKYRALIEPDVRTDTRKLDTLEAFTVGIYGPLDGSQAPATTLKGFIEQRRAALLAHPDIVRARQPAQDMPADYKQVLTSLERTGDFKDGALKVNIPRGDLSVTISGRPAPTPFGFGGWVAFTKGEHGDVMMGDLVLREDEVSPVMSALLDNGLEVTALHNHFFWEQPRIFYLHVHGMGAAADLARKLKPALALIPKPPASTGGAPAPASVTGAAVSTIIGHPGEQSGPVYKITVGRPDIDMREHGARINARMGLNTWAAFAGTDDNAMVAGDVAMLESEVNGVLKALRANGLHVVAIHHHMTSVQPMVVFLHYYGTGPAASLARGVRAAMDQTGHKGR